MNQRNRFWPVLLLLGVTALLQASVARGQTDDWPAVFDPFQVVTLHLEMDTNDWETVKADTSLTLERPARMWAEGETNKLLVEVKRKSDPAIGTKVSLKVDINALVPGQEWRGCRKLSLENGSGNSILKEGFAHYLHRLAWQHGIYPYNPGLAAWVKLYVNGEYIGVYGHMEERDKQFLKHRGMWKENATWLYKNDPNPVLETGSGGDSPTYAALCFSPFRSACPQPNLETTLPAFIDLSGMLTLGAIEAFTMNSDGLFTHDGKNVFFVDFQVTNHLKRLYFPWDLDTGIGDTAKSQAVFGFAGAYSTEILNHYWFRQCYLHIMADLLDGPLSAASLTAFLDQLEPVLSPALASDVNSGLDEPPADHFQSIRTWVTNRIANVRGQVGPVIGWPHFNQNGGEIIPGFLLSLSHTNDAGTIYYTLDGTDPRGYGGTPAGIEYAGAPLVLSATTHVRARVRQGTNWSALRQATFNIAHALDSLKVTEIMFHPRSAATGEDGDEFEFLELKNTGSATLNLSGCSFEGLDYRFPPGTLLGPGSFALLVRNSLHFANRYPGKPIRGIYFGGLDNSGEKLRLLNSDGNNVVSVAYDDDPPWPLGPDGFGYSLVNVLPDADPDRPEQWRASAGVDGSPGAEDPAPAYSPGVVISEVLTHTDPPLMDAIELHNPTAGAIDISGWYLSDQIDNSDPTGALLKKFKIPAGTIIPAGGYRVFYETNFNPNPALPPSFALSQFGDQVYFASADSGGNLSGYLVGARFGAAENAVAFGRVQTSLGFDFATLQARTLGTNNAGPKIGPVVISEIMYHPSAGRREFIEFRNLTGTAVDLSGWSLNGAGRFVFPPGTSIAAQGWLLLVGTTNTHAEEFRAAYQVPATVPVLTHRFELQNDGEELGLLKPNDPPGDPPILVDRVRYNDKSPWPTEADGEGPSLERVPVSAYGNEPLHWRTAAHGGSPGRDGDYSRIVAVATTSSWRHHALSYNLGTPWAGSDYSDSGWPSGDGVLGYGQLSVNTLVSNAAGILQRPITTYFRKEFVVSDSPAEITGLVLQARYDDGFVAFINGREVVRRSLPAGPVDFSTLAQPHEGTAYEFIDLTSVLDVLVRGGNVLAVEVHQATAGDPDLVWDASLTYYLADAYMPPLQISSVSVQSEGVKLFWNSQAGRQYRIERTADFVTWTDLGFLISANGPSSEYLDTTTQSAGIRYYRVLVVSP